MKKIVLLFATGSIICTSCSLFKKSQTAENGKQEKTQVSAPDGFTATPSGLKYKITNKGTGTIKPNAGDKVEVHYTGKFLNDTVFDSSYKRGKPLPFYIGKGMVIKGWDEGIAMLNEGDKATFIIPPEIGYGARQMGSIPPNSTLVFDVELIKITPKIKPAAFDTKGKDTVTTASGLKYIIVQEGTGRVPFQGAQVTVHYTGFFKDGNVFDSSVERGNPFTFSVGKGQVIKGWDEACQTLKTGTKARLLIPWNLAYGERGMGQVIPPKSDLIFDIEIIEYK